MDDETKQVADKWDEAMGGGLYEDAEGKSRELLEREACMARARNLICGDRADQYGDFKLNYGKTAKLMSAITGVHIDTGQVLLMLVGMKLARETTQHKQNNIDDAVGYLALYSELMADEQGGAE